MWRDKLLKIKDKTTLYHRELTSRHCDLPRHLLWLLASPNIALVMGAIRAFHVSVNTRQYNGSWRVDSELPCRGCKPTWKNLHLTDEYMRKPLKMKNIYIHRKAHWITSHKWFPKWTIQPPPTPSLCRWEDPELQWRARERQGTSDPILGEGELGWMGARDVVCETRGRQPGKLENHCSILTAARV